MHHVLRRYWLWLVGVFIIVGGCSLMLNPGRRPDQKFQTDVTVKVMAVSPDGSFVAFEQGPQVGLTLERKLGPNSVVLSGFVVVRHMSERGERYRFAAPGITAVTFSQDSSQLFGVDAQGKFYQWSMADGSGGVVFQRDVLAYARPGYVHVLPDVNQVVIYGGDSGNIQQTTLHRQTDGAVLDRIEGCAVYTSDAQYALIYIEPQGYIVRERATNRTLVSIPGQKGELIACPLAIPNGTDALIRGSAGQPNLVVNMSTGRIRQAYIDPNPNRLVAVRGDSQQVAVSRPGGGSSGLFGFAPFSGSSNTPRTIAIWDLTSGQRVSTLPGPPGGVHALAWSGDGRWLVASGEYAESGIYVWDMTKRGWFGWW